MLSRHAAAAGLVGKGMTSGLNMHRARHTFAKDCDGSLGAASQALGQSDPSTTAAIYGHYDLSDLERAMEALARAPAAPTTSRPTETVSIDRRETACPSR